MTMHAHEPTLGELDRDGAIEEAASKAGISRSSFFRRSGAFVGGGLLVGGLPMAFATAQGDIPASDIDILNYALTLEYLEAAFYNEAVEKGALKGRLAEFAKVVAEHENAHVDALKKTLGDKAVKKPSFDFKGTTGAAKSFADTAKVLEDAGVAAYLGQAGAIKATPVLQAAASILPVEARHAAWIASIIGNGAGTPSPAADAFQPAQSMTQILAAVSGTGFITRESGADAGSSVSGTPNVAG
jgi:hypothetical protein